jgi:hypothetical protein
MRTVDLSSTSPTVNELLDLADEDLLIIKAPSGREFVLAEVEDFEDEIARTRQNAELMALLDERSRETVTYTLEQVRERLKLKQARPAEG